MDTAMEFTRNTAPFILTFLLGWIFVNISKTGDPGDISNRAKLNAAVASGFLMGFLLMVIECENYGVLSDPKAWIKYMVMGFSMGTSAIGLNQLMKPKPTAENTQKTVDKLVVAERKEVVKEAIEAKVPIPPPAAAPIPAPLKPEP